MFSLLFSAKVTVYRVYFFSFFVHFNMKKIPSKSHGLVFLVRGASYEASYKAPLTSTMVSVSTSTVYCPTLTKLRIPMYLKKKL